LAIWPSALGQHCFDHAKVIPFYTYLIIYIYNFKETVAAVLDIKFCNVVVEALIEHCERIFGSAPQQKIEPCPPKPAKNNGGTVNIGGIGDGQNQNNPFMPTMIDESFSSKSSDDLNSSLSEINIMDSTELYVNVLFYEPMAIT
jgi:hypothetical protein